MIDPVTIAQNPLREGLDVVRTADPAIMVIFGASGDLARRKLIPALYNLACQRLLPPGFTVVGYARTPNSDEGFREQAKQGVLQHGSVDFQEEVWDSFAQGLYYISGPYDSPEGFQKLAARLEELNESRNARHNRLFYLATPPTVYEPVTTNLGAAGLGHSPGNGWTRLVIEKPFGHDLASAMALNDHLLTIFDEDQIYRIDHYLGKETVQNILVFRFANGIFEPIWNRNYVDHVQITVAESIGVEGRGGYYDRSGALRDMVQNHLMQLVALTAMEPPVAFDAKAVRDQKVNLMRSIRPLALDEVPRYTVRAQYAAGVSKGRRLPGYVEEPGVAPGSTTETYVAWKLEIENWRWSGVPFYLRTGKALPKKISEVAIYFRQAPHLLFSSTEHPESLVRNVLAMRIQPNEGISLKISAKQPGPAVHVQPVSMDFHYGSSFGRVPPDAYERLLLDVVLGDGTLFTRRDEVEVAWERVTRVLDGWRMQEEEASQSGKQFALPVYEAGTWGPAEADALLSTEGQSWRRL
jgi:glucose-6-phosphate 1-dehydrogenase